MKYRSNRKKKDDGKLKMENINMTINKITIKIKLEIKVQE